MVPMGLFLRSTVLFVAVLFSLPDSLLAAPLATYQLSRGWATFGLALPQGAATTVQIGTIATQTDVKTTWPDGTTRFAVVTARIPVAGQYPIASGSQATGAFKPPAYPASAVSFVIAGRSYTADPLTARPLTPWLMGSLVREYRVISTPTDDLLGTDQPLLQVIYDARIYRDGTARVDVQVQNVKDIQAGGPVTYGVTITINGKTMFSRSSVTQAYMTRWRKAYWTYSAESTVVPDFEPFYLAGALPRYLSTVADPIPTTTGSKFDPLQFGDMSADMQSPGGRPELAPYPNWTVQYLVHKRPAQRAYMLATADLAGSWSGHITEADGTTLIDLDHYPNYWLDGRSGVHPTGPNATRVLYMGGLFPGGWSQGLETAHIPSLTFVPYLLTGDRFYLDQMKFWANFTLIKTWPGTGERQGGKGILMENQPRGYGWALRNLADTTAFLPDADPLKAYFRSRLQNNLDFLETYGKTHDGGPFAFTFVEKFGVNPLGNRVTSLWMASYVGMALDRARALGFGPTASMLTRIVKTQILLFSSDAAGYPKIAGAPYYPDVGKATSLTTTQWYTLPQIYQQTGLSNVGGTGSAAVPFAGFFGPEARMMLQIGVREQMAGAKEALDYLMPFIASDINSRSGWAILP